MSNFLTKTRKYRKAKISEATLGQPYHVQFFNFENKEVHHTEDWKQRIGKSDRTRWTNRVRTFLYFHHKHCTHCAPLRHWGLCKCYWPSAILKLSFVRFRSRKKKGYFTIWFITSAFLILLIFAPKLFTIFYPTLSFLLFMNLTSSDHSFPMSSAVGIVSRFIGELLHYSDLLHRSWVCFGMQQTIQHFRIS